MKILITDPIEKSCVEILTQEGFQVDEKPGLPPDEIKKIIGEYVALVVRSGTKVTADIIEQAHAMKIIGRAGAGVDNIDAVAASKKGIIVMNTPGGNTISTAEHTFSLIMSLSRNIPQANASMAAEKWDRKKFMGTELYGKTLGLVGLGKVGAEVATRAQAFGMKTIGFDPVLSQDAASKLHVELVSLDEIYRRSDYITVHTPLNNETRSLLNDKTIAQCKKGVRMINCARGGIIDEGALLRGLESGHIAGAALDVFVEEPPKNLDLIRHPKVVVTPHLGASTEEAQEKVAIQIAHQIADALHERGIVGAVNASALSAGIPQEIKPFLELSEKLGKLLAQVMAGKLKELSIELRGELLHKHTELLKAGMLRGLLMQSKQEHESINYINAPILAQSMGIKVSEKKETVTDDYPNLITLSYITDEESRSFAGTVLSGKYQRIVRLDKYLVEGTPEGTYLYYTNIDRPGMLAKVGTILAEANINIAGLSLGRSGVGERALTVVSVDNPIPNEVLDKVKSLDGIFHAKVVQL